jgi:HAD superfamily hydrolase (TIGR01549 family)
MRAILFDLDNTLLENDMEDFIPAYLDALGGHMSDLYQPDEFIRTLMRATSAMVADPDPSFTNMEAFDSAFFPALGCERADLEPMFDQFYCDHFPNLRSVTETKPEARSVVEWVFAQGYQVAIATNPLFPLTAIEQRLEWAGLPVEEFPFALITSYESMHATKPHTAYYKEIARRLGVAEDQCLMIGDEWRLDIAPAHAVGMQVYWIADPDTPPPSPDIRPSGQGNLSNLIEWLRQYQLDT